MPRWFVDWLQRRDALSAAIAADDLAAALESVATELRREAREEATVRTSGLIIAATVLVDTAGSVRVGEQLIGDD